MPDTQTDWHAAGCARDCSEQHTYKLGRCALSTDTPPEPTVSISRIETMADGQPGIVLRSIPASVWDGLIAVAAHVSTGRGFAFVGQGPYPDAKARRILGALHDAGLLPQPEEPAAQPAPAAAGPHTGLAVEPYRNDRGDNVWVFRCWGSDSCDGWLSLDHHSEQSAERARDRHIAEEHAEPAEPVTVTDPAWLHRQYAAIIGALHDNRPDHIAAELLRVHDRHLQQLRQLRQRLRLADELLATRDAELAAAKKTARGVGAWGVLQAIEQALPPARDNGPTVREAAADDARWWGGEKAGE